MRKALTDDDYAALAEFRFALRQFVAFSEGEAAERGLTPQQHQALLVIRASSFEEATIGHVAERLILKPHSATGLIDRLEAQGLVRRRPSPNDKRRAVLELTDDAHRVLEALSATHREEIRRIGPMLTGLVDRIDRSA